VAGAWIVKEYARVFVVPSLCPTVEEWEPDGSKYLYRGSKITEARWKPDNHYDPLFRNHAMVDYAVSLREQGHNVAVSGFLYRATEQDRGGTQACIRYARKCNFDHMVFEYCGEDYDS
jgi:hypothetical protein